MKYSHVIAAAASQYWALEPKYMEAMSAVLQRVSAGLPVSPEVKSEIEAAQAARAARKQSNASIGGGIAVLPLYGAISQRMSSMDDICGAGGTSTERFMQSFRYAMADDSVGGIIIDIDSPGGSVFGVADLYDEIMGARGTKPVYGFVNSLCASAAYWLGSACSQLFAVQGSMTGSIGVYTRHVDCSAAMEMEGVKAEFISAGTYKVEGNSFGPLSDEARAFTQSQINAYYAAFTQAVAKGRGVPVASVRGGMGQGRCLLPADALAEGMIDAVDTFDGVVKRMKSAMKAGGPRAELDAPEIQAAVEQPAPAAETIAPSAAESFTHRAAARDRAIQIASK
jgi:signal peptide peptidase SppA